MLTSAIRRGAPKQLMNLAKRGVYTAETKPHVFINKHTKVLVQGMTGKHVSLVALFYSLGFRGLSIQSKQLNMELTLLEE